MSICRQWSLVKHAQNTAYARPLYCRSWNCETCRPKRKAQLLAQAASGQPTKFITLTANPRVGASPRDRLRMLSAGWRNCVKRLHRLYPSHEIEYMAVVEGTKRGEPHLHILYRGPWVDQRKLSAWMAHFADAPIVDVRAVRGRREAVRYVAKYISKKPEQFGTAKRYWRSYHYSAPREEGLQPVIPIDPPWLLSRVPIEMLFAEFKWRGYRVYSMEPEYMVATWEPGRG